MSQPATITATPAVRRRTCKLTGLAFILLGLTLALPSVAFAAGWSPQSSGTSGDTYLYSAAFANASDGWVVGGDSDTNVSLILATTDGGATWSPQDSGAFVDTQLGAVAFANAGDGWAVGQDADGNVLILATTTGGCAAPTLTGFTPPSGPVGTSVTLAGTGLNGTTGVKFNGVAAPFTVNSDTQITATVPSGAKSGAITVNTPGGTGASAASFALIPVTPDLTLKLSGLKGGALKFGKSVTARGALRPTSLAGSRVTLIVQRKQGSKWRKVTTLTRTISAGGAYSDTCKPAKKGSYRMEATIAKAATHTAAATKWLTFRVE